MQKCVEASAVMPICERLEIAPTRYLLTVSVREQAVWLWEAVDAAVTDRRYKEVRRYRCSTSRFGIGQKQGSNCTPLGLHRIAQKIGDGCPVGTVFKSRKPVGLLSQGMPLESITTRIMWLEGLEPGFNQGGDVDTFNRYIYIHGTGDEPTIGKPASHGCIHLAADDLVPLYDLLPVGTLVWISAD